MFVISGGAIKLTENMNTRNHLLNELKKMEITQKFLQQQNLTHDYNFDFLELSV
jgi:hypothetical protein